MLSVESDDVVDRLVSFKEVLRNFVKSSRDNSVLLSRGQRLAPYPNDGNASRFYQRDVSPLRGIILGNPDAMRPIVFCNVIDDIGVRHGVFWSDRKLFLDTVDRISQPRQGRGYIRVEAIIKNEEGLAWLKWLQALVPML